jgi:zinc protease
MNTDFLNDVEFDQIENLYRERISDADDFTFFIVGNIEIETVKPMVEKYIGSLSSADGNENWVDTKVRAPEGRVVKEIEITLAVPKSTVFLNFVTDLEYTPYNNQTLKVIKGILDLVYTETIREDEGGTYGVATGISLQQYPVSKARTVINFDCDPEKANHLKSIVYDEIKKLYTDGPDQEDLSKAVNNILKNREESKQHNSYWLSAIYNYYYRGINYDDPANYEDILNSLTIDDIKEAALSLFKDADVVDLIFKPKSEE